MQRIGIVGGGAAGLFCAAYLAYYTSYPITIYEKNNRVGKKLLVTGNGKCNLSNIHWHSCVYNHPQIMDLIASFDVEKTRDFFKKIGLLTKVDSNGRVYPYSETATSVLETLRQFLIQKKVTFICDCFIKAIEKKQHYFILKSCSQTYQEDYVILSTGGLAYYQKSNSYTLLSSFNHTVTPLSPSLTGIKTIEKFYTVENNENKYTELNEAQGIFVTEFLYGLIISVKQVIKVKFYLKKMVYRVLLFFKSVILSIAFYPIKSN